MTQGGVIGGIYPGPSCEAEGGKLQREVAGTLAEPAGCWRAESISLALMTLRWPLASDVSYSY